MPQSTSADILWKKSPSKHPARRDEGKNCQRNWHVGGSDQQIKKQLEGESGVPGKINDSS
jgi:hypothetical protein